MHTRTVLREADFLVTVSGDLRNKAVAMGASAEKTRAIINGCDLSVFHVRTVLRRAEAGHRSGRGGRCLHRRMDVKKGLHELVEAAASLRPTRANLQVYLIGEGRTEL